LRYIQPGTTHTGAVVQSSSALARELIENSERTIQYPTCTWAPVSDGIRTRVFIRTVRTVHAVWHTRYSRMD